MLLRWAKIDGEDYGRGYIEEYLGDLSTMEDLTKALVEFAAMASRVLFFVNPNGTTNIQKLQSAANGDYLVGDAARDITNLQVEKYNDFRVVKDLLSTIEQRLGYAFLLNTSVQRAGERVTAEEIRFMARELEDALGGVYTIQSQDLQLPLTKVVIAQLERLGELPELPPDIVPAIVTGIDALGRGQDLAMLDAFVDGALQKFEGASQYINWPDYLTRRASALGIDMDGLIKSPEQVAEEEQQAQMMQMAQTLGPEGLKQAGAVGQQAMKEASPDAQG